ncbi:MAG: hypothetical protein ACREOY_00635 [Candidatus Dormibacteraceae bacterium]
MARSLHLEKAAIDIAAELDELGQVGQASTPLGPCGVRGAEARAPIDRAIELLEPLPPTRELAAALAGVVLFHMNLGDFQTGSP